MRLISFFLLLLPVTAMAEQVYWQDSPVNLVISQSQPRKIILPGEIINVSVREPVKQASRIVRLPKTNYLHWQAESSFQDEVAIITIKGNKNYLFSVSVQDELPDTELTLIDDNHSQSYDMASDLGLDPGEINPGTPPNQGQTTTPMPVQATVEQREAYTYDQLVAFAAQHHMGPVRLIKALPGVTSIPVKQKPAPLLRFFQGSTIPIKSWTDGEVFVTSVAVRNTSSLRFEIDVRWLNGRFLFFVPPIALPDKKSIYNSAWAFVVSDRPFWEALK